MQNFWYGNNRIVNDEETYGSGGAGIVLSGNDWLGLGQVFGGLSQGTEMCGARPLWAGSSRTAWEECNRSAILLYQQNAQQTAQVQSEQIKSQEDIARSKKMTIIVIVSLVSVALILTVFLIVRKKRRKAS